MLKSLALLVSSSVLMAQPSFFEAKVQPILRANCIACHSEKNINSGLSVETRE
ncbi:MAG: hypothetical protein JNK34_13560, partial [Tabrizicola sp.]|nr:hypothetical protein [Tabrizicola sp.]